jgi:integrase
MKIEKLPSGSYRIRKMYKGKAYSVTVDYKPTQKEALQLLAAEMDNYVTDTNVGSFAAAAGEYIEMKRNVLSPATLREYTRYVGRLPQDFVALRVSDITQVDVQKMVNELSRDKSPKTVCDLHGFVHAVIKTFRPNFALNTTLPQKQEDCPYIPTDSDIRTMLDHAKGGRYEIPLRLACYGLRREEICALESSDLDGNTLVIDKAYVMGEDNKWILKVTKTPSSVRAVIIDDELADMIRAKDGRVFSGFPGTISNYLAREQKKLGLPRFSLHKFRHYYASISHTMGVPDAYIMASGGWKTDHVLKAVYRHALSDRTADMQRQISSHISGLAKN